MMGDCEGSIWWKIILNNNKRASAMVALSIMAVSGSHVKHIMTISLKNQQ